MSPHAESVETLAVAEQAPEVTEPDPFVGLSDEGRLAAAGRLGLPQTASWKDISLTAAERSRETLLTSPDLETNVSIDPKEHPSQTSGPPNSLETTA